MNHPWSCFGLLLSLNPGADSVRSYPNLSEIVAAFVGAKSSNLDRLIGPHDPHDPQGPHGELVHREYPKGDPKTAIS